MVIKNLLLLPIGFSFMGLCFDILGAYYIAQSLIAKTVTEIERETRSPLFGWNKHTVWGIQKQKIESRIGFVFLAFGFFLQAIGTIYAFKPLRMYIFLLIFAGSLALMTVFHKYMTSDKQMARFTADRLARYKEQKLKELEKSS